MDLATLLRKGTPSELREIGEMLIGLASMPRDAGSAAVIEATVAKFEDPEEGNLAKVLHAARLRAVHREDGLRGEGMNHANLIQAELERRGDQRTVTEYIADVCGGYLQSDIR